MKKLILLAVLLTGTGVASLKAQELSVGFSMGNRNGYVAGSYVQPGVGSYDPRVVTHAPYNYRDGQNQTYSQPVAYDHHELHRDLRAERAEFNRYIDSLVEDLHRQIQRERAAGTPEYVTEQHHKAGHRQIQNIKQAGRQAIRYGHEATDAALDQSGHWH